VLRHYSGHHDILFRSASKNLGVCGNQNLVFSRAEGELVVVFEGDDISVPTRVSQLTAAYISNDRRVSALGSSVIRIDEDGAPHETVVWPTTKCGAVTFVRNGWAVAGCTIAFRRDCFEEVGRISHHLLSGDIALWMRAVFMPGGRLLQIPSPLVYYRGHSANVSRSRLLTYNSLESLTEFASAWVRNEIAQVGEWRKIAKYRAVRTDESDRDAKEFVHLGRVIRARARLTYAIAKCSRASWVIPVLSAARFSSLRRFSLRCLIAAFSPRLFHWLARCPSETAEQPLASTVGPAK
jgi:hypothetical protein